MQEEHRPLNYAGLALAMIVGAIGIVAINLHSARDFIEAALLKRARAHYADSLVSQRWLKHEAGAEFFPLPAARSHAIRLVGARPLNPDNAPDEWERATLRRFSEGLRERSENVRRGEVTEYRYLAPVIVEARCLGCHAAQGFKLGEVAGGISVAFDASDTEQALNNNVIATGIAIVLIMLGVGQVMVFSIRRVRQLGRMTDSERARFEALVQTVDGIVWEADPKTLQFSFVSRHAVTLMGYPLEAWMRPGFWVEHLHPDDRARVIARRNADAGRSDASELEYRFVARNGATVWVNDRVSLVLNDARPGVLRGIMIDVTARRRTEKEASKLLRAVEQSPVSIIITDRDGVIEYVNPRFTQLFGYTRNEVVGRTPRLFKSGAMPAEIYEDLWRTVLSGKEWRGRLLNRCKNGDTLWEDATITPVFDENGEITHFLAVKEDITEHLRVEEELARYRDHLEDQVRARTEDLVLAMQKATAADRAKSEFLTNMSHEIRTPLNAVIGFCELAQRTGLTARQRDYLEKIDSAGQHLLQLINNLLDLSKIAAGRVEISTSEFDLPQLMARISSVLSYKASEKGLDFQIVVDHDVPRRLLGDSLRVNQVLLNLINNAIKFTERGTIRVDVHCLHSDDAFTRVGFTVEDTGIGMDEAELRRAFEPFAQGDASISRKYGGTGLGLSISRDLIGLMGGQLDARSEKGSGSRFAFALDFGNVLASTPSAADTALESLPADEEYGFAGLHVLLVEDQPLNRQVAGEIMEARGVRVDMATNGREAIDLLFAHGPEAFDLVLMDLQMPEFDGISAMKAIRARPEFELLPMVAMTAHVLEEERRRAAAAGANGHLGKPFSPDQLYETLARWAPAGKVQRVPRTPPPAVVDAPDSAMPPVDGAVIDWPEGLERFNGRSEKYLQWLRRFAGERRAVAADTATQLAEGRADEAAQQVHALKGVAGMLGLKRVFEAARALEMSCREQVVDPARVVDPAVIECLQGAIDEAMATIAALPETIDSRS